MGLTTENMISTSKEPAGLEQGILGNIIDWDCRVIRKNIKKRKKNLNCNLHKDEGSRCVKNY